jgi:hypothetical protein
MGKECENLEVLRSVCNEEMGSCERTDANNSANLGELCEEKNNCTEDATYGCFDFEIPGINLDNYCTKICSSDSDCSGLINSKCQSFVITAFCIKPCTSDNDCKLILEDETATCNNEKCETN